jgi:nucleoid DNA-binding protein
MANSRIGRGLLISKVQKVLALPTKKEAEDLVNTVVSCIEGVLVDNLMTDKFSMKLGSFGKFSVHHRSGSLRKIPFTGEIKLTDDKRKIKFVSLGRLRQLEKRELSTEKGDQI